MGLQLLFFTCCDIALCRSSRTHPQRWKLHGAICKLEQQIRDGVDSVFAGAGTATPASRGLFSLADELEAMQRERDSLLQSVGHLCKRFFMLLPV